MGRRALYCSDVIDHRYTITATPGVRRCQRCGRLIGCPACAAPFRLPTEVKVVYCNRHAAGKEAPRGPEV